MTIRFPLTTQGEAFVAAIPPNLNLAELSAWLDGAGFDLAVTIPRTGGVSHVFNVRVDSVGWPCMVAVADLGGELTVTPHYDEAELADD